MMKPPFKAFDGAINVMHCIVCVFIKLYKHDLDAHL